MKTVLLVSPYWREQHRWMVSGYKLADLWQRLGYRVVVACMGSETKTVKASDTLTVHARKDVFLKDPWNYGIALGFGGFVARLAKEEKPDVIVVNKLLFWSSLAALSLRLRGHRVVQITDALVGMTWWPRSRPAAFCAAIYAWTLGWLLLLNAERVVFFHPQPETLLRRLGIAKKSTVIPTGIDPKPYGRPETGDQNAPVDGSGLRSQVSSSSSVTVTYVGRLESVKGVDDFLAAVAPLLDEIPGLAAQVAGWYPEGHPLVERYQRAVAFLGLRDDVPALLGRTDIFVLPSHSEGLSNALMEAMASGCACIASDVGGNRYLIENGVSGLLFPAGDREALRSHVRRLARDAAKRKALGEAARARIDAVFSWEKVGALYDELFRTMA
jgi:glycosyltransferase involved in cell wall biosynthesis